MTATFISKEAEDKFSLNGVDFFQIYMPQIFADRIRIVNVYDARNEILPWTRYDEFQIDGQTFANVTDLNNALVDVIYSSAVVSSGKYNGVSGDPGNALTNGNDGGPYLDENLLSTSSDGGSDPTSQAHGIISFNSGYISGLDFQPTATWDFYGSRYNKTQPISLDPADANNDRIDVIAVDIDGNIVKITGTPADSPEKPVVDPTTQIEATFFLIKATATAPDGVSQSYIYNEGSAGEWTATDQAANLADPSTIIDTSGRIDVQSANASKVGNYSIEATGLKYLDRVILTPAAAVAIDNFPEMSFYLRLKNLTTEAQPLRIIVRGTTRRGAGFFFLGDLASNGLDRSSLSTWQFLSYAIADAAKRNNLLDITSIEFVNYATDAEGFGFFLDAVSNVAGTTDNNTGGGGSVDKKYVDEKDAETLDAAKAYADSLGGGGGGTITTEEITTDATTFDGTQKGLYKIYKFNGVNNQNVIIDAADYAKNDIIHFQRGVKGLEIIPITGTTAKGVRDINNRFFINDANSFAAAKLDADGKFLIFGNLKRGYSGAVTTSSYSELTSEAVAHDVTVTGTGFSENILISLTGNAVLNSWTFINNNQITLNITPSGVAGDSLTITYDNGDLFTDSSLTIVEPFEIATAANLVEYWEEGTGDDNSSATYSKTGINGKILSASGEANPTLSGTEWEFNGTDQGFRLNDAEINTLLNQDVKDFQIHYKGNFIFASRILAAANVGTAAPSSFWNMVFSGDGSKVEIVLNDANSDQVRRTVKSDAPGDKDYLVSIRFRRADLGVGTQNVIDVIIDDGATAITTSDIDASNLNASAISEIFIGMKETDTKSFYNCKFKSLVICNTSENFDKVRNELTF